ncbi:hypothetical protein SD311_005100 [Staphylococcus sp. KG4-3]|uniref:hypothetical protein n=1 Tax=Staphylococcus sp. KG4-3 TaxID=3093634 RepID=UPI00298F3550|nr:hypothetical protein [Staphylococcus sp. KG4-3]MDW8544404.1 hypothetical protein [Staphylococcus sp. KG4-1]MDW8560838.1 hypothetical protein [Staphylococcus sp. KG4-3]
MNEPGTMKIKYYAKFEKVVSYPRRPNEEEQESLEWIGQDMDKHVNDYLDGTFIEFSEPEVKD